MIRKLIVVLTLLLVAETCSFGWGRTGHATVARIAENHLTKRTKRALSVILKGEPISGYASYADDHKNELTIDVGFDPANGGKRVMAQPHTFEADMHFEPFRGINDKGRYVKNCIHFILQYSEDLKHWKTLDDSSRFTELVLLVHFLGDMHCPEHIRYNPEDMTIGYYDIQFQGEVMQYHKYWDSVMMETKYPWSFSDLAYLLDSCSAREQARIVEGDAYDWGKDSAMSCYAAHQIREGMIISQELFYSQLSLMKSQLRKAGYRLAHQLNLVFDPHYARRPYFF